MENAEAGHLPLRVSVRSPRRSCERTLPLPDPRLVQPPAHPLALSFAFKTPERIYFSSFALPFFLFLYDKLSPRLAPRTGAAPQLPAAHPGTLPAAAPSIAPQQHAEHPALSTHTVHVLCCPGGCSWTEGTEPTEEQRPELPAAPCRSAELHCTHCRHDDVFLGRYRRQGCFPSLFAGALLRV